MAEYILNTNNISQWASTLKMGDRVLLSGTVFTSRDAAHKRITEYLISNKELPYDLKNAVIYYAGPTPAPENMAVGSCGPTTSGRMDSYAPKFLDLGLKGMIGKGERNDSVIAAIKRNGAVYFAAIGGAGALASKCIVKCEEIAFFDLGCESVKRMEFKDFPLTVAIDSTGNDIYKR